MGDYGVKEDNEKEMFRRRLILKTQKLSMCQGLTVALMTVDKGPARCAVVCGDCGEVRVSAGQRAEAQQYGVGTFHHGLVGRAGVYNDGEVTISASQGELYYYIGQSRLCPI